MTDWLKALGACVLVSLPVYLLLLFIVLEVDG